MKIYVFNKPKKCRCSCTLRYVDLSLLIPERISPIDSIVLLQKKNKRVAAEGEE